MMEYQAVVKVGRKNVSINFADGSMTAMGSNPATYTTSSIILQDAIESSEDFKRGRITKLRTIELAEELQVMRNSVATESEETRPTEEISPEPTEAPATPEEDAGEMTEVEFSCNDDAKDYLEQTFGYIRSKLRNREDIVAAGKAHGVTIIFV